MVDLSQTSPGRPVCLVFGPQITEIDESLFYISCNIDENPALHFLKDVLRELPSLWSTISDTWAPLSSIPGAAQLTALADCVQGGPIATHENPTSVLLTPLTVIRQIIDAWKFKEKSQNKCRIVDAQGFCVGFLAAVAVACSNDAKEFADIASTMVRLAVCIGTAVDLDGISHGQARSVAVRWKSASENEQLNRLLTSSSTVRDIYQPNRYPILSNFILSYPSYGSYFALERVLTMGHLGLRLLLYGHKLGHSYSRGGRSRRLDQGAGKPRIVSENYRPEREISPCEPYHSCSIP
jgi:hypothetical protein